MELEVADLRCIPAPAYAWCIRADQSNPPAEARQLIHA